MRQVQNRCLAEEVIRLRVWVVGRAVKFPAQSLVAGSIGLGEGELVADVGAADPEDDVFGDVGGVVGGALEVAADDDGVERLAADDRVLLHDFDEFGLDVAVHVVDLVVHGEDGFGELGVGFEQRLDGAADHDADFFAHVGDVDGEGDLGRVVEESGRAAAMLVAWSPMRSRSPLILMTERMKRRSIAMGCSLASRS